jgi:hypothetical protein
VCRLFVLFGLTPTEIHMCERVRNSFGLSELRIHSFRYLFD